jgi:hypothetical protein
MDKVVFVLSLDFLRNQYEFYVWTDIFGKKKKKNAGFIVKSHKIYAGPIHIFICVNPTAKIIGRDPSARL